MTTFRRDVRTDGRHAEVEFGASLDEDLARRDFTINAIAYSPSRQILHDPFDWREDLDAAGRPRRGTAADRMREDRLRALRALRFAGRFGFAIEAETWAAIVASAPYLTQPVGRASQGGVGQDNDPGGATCTGAPAVARQRCTECVGAGTWRVEWGRHRDP